MTGSHVDLQGLRKDLTALGFQIVQSKPFFCTLSLKVGIIDVLGALGFWCGFELGCFRAAVSSVNLMPSEDM